MNKILKVVKPFYMLEVGDTLQLAEDGKSYVSEVNDEYHVDNEHGNLGYSYSAKFTMPASQVEEYIAEEYLEPLDTKQETFKNVFDEMDRLINTYNSQLSSLDDDYKDQPLCLKNEKLTVLTNMVQVLNHLKSLKK